MPRLLAALPLALAICYGLIAVMAWMVDLNSKPLKERSEPLQFNIFVTEQEQAGQRMSRILPAPPELTPQPVKPEQVQPRTQTAMAPPSLESLPELQMDLSVAGMEISVPSPKLSKPATSGTAAVAAPVQVGQNQQVMPLQRIEPVYPRKALLRKIEGYVVLSFAIDRSGKPDNIKIVEAKPARVFNREALKALKSWRYQPQMVNGKARKRPGQRIKLEFKLH